MLKAKTKKIDPSADVSGQPDSKKEQEEKMNKAKTKKVSSFPNVAGPADSIVETAPPRPLNAASAVEALRVEREDGR